MMKFNLYKLYNKYNYLLRAFLILIVVTLTSQILREHLETLNISLLHLIPIVLVAIYGDIIATVIITVVSLILYNFLYIPPLYTFNVHSKLYIWSFIIFVTVGVIITYQAKRLHAQTKENKIRESLLDIVSHDLRTPLSIIHGSINLLLTKEELDKETAQNLLLDINYASLRMDRVITNLLDSARLKQGNVDLKFEWCDFEDILGVALENFEQKQCNDLIEIEIDDNLELYWGDNALLVQMMTNLIDNAFKYSKKNKKIKMQIKNIGKSLKILVSNESEFVDKKKIEHIFDKFYRLEDSNDISGSGIGLFICQSIVKLHGGNIKAYYIDKRVSMEITLPILHKV